MFKTYGTSWKGRMRKGWRERIRHKWHLRDDVWELSKMDQKYRVTDSRSAVKPGREHRGYENCWLLRQWENPHSSSIKLCKEAWIGLTADFPKETLESRKTMQWYSQSDGRKTFLCIQWKISFRNGGKIMIFSSRDRELRELIASRFRVEERQNSLGRRKMITNGSAEVEEGMKSRRKSKCVEKDKLIIIVIFRNNF